MSDNFEEVMLDLLCKRAIYGLTPEEEKELSVLQRRAGVADDSLSLELTAAAIATIGVDMSEEMPTALRERIVANAGAHLPKPSAPMYTLEKTSPGGSIFSWLGWAFAAIAVAALGLNIYVTRQATTPVGPIVEITPTPTPEKKISPAEMRNALMASGKPLVRGALGAGTMKDLQPVGDVVWSDETQEGYVRVTGLPKNDPTKETYQLWIVAENQNPKTPVDGGTFDVTTDGEVIIPIDAKVKALKPQAFAITMEKPGGVPVSEQKKVAALAKRET